MKKLLIISISALLAATMITGCASKPKSSAKTVTESKKESKKRVIFVTADGFSKNLLEVVTIPTAEKDSAFAKASEDNPVDLMAFYISQTETTYARWYEVYTWAKDNGYTFANPGREGSAGVDGAEPTGSEQPVTSISWRDAVVWCNAASEKDGLTPVYKYNGAVLKESDNAKDGDGKAENAIIDENANGYRLPTEAEWEFTARGGDPYSENWAKLYGAADKAGSVAWCTENSGETTHDVKTKAENPFGLYDMNGNVWEWCYNPWSNNPMRRTMRGGSYRKPAENVTVVSRDYAPVSRKYDDVGFRVVKFALSARDAK